jgi:hypothetical protein
MTASRGLRLENGSANIMSTNEDHVVSDGFGTSIERWCLVGDKVFERYVNRPGDIRSREVFRICGQCGGFGDSEGGYSQDSPCQTCGGKRITPLL